MSELHENELRISIEAGSAYEPTERVAAAIHELMAAVDEADGSDVSGFSRPSLVGGFNIFYVSPVTYTANDGLGKKKGNVEYSWKIEEGTI